MDFVPRWILPHLAIHGAILVVFTTLYVIFRRKLIVQSTPPRKASVADAVYYGVATHTLLGDNTTFPDAIWLKMLSMTHVVAAWAITLSISAQ